MTELPDRARPIVRGCAGFNADKTGLEFYEEGLDLRTTKLTAKNPFAMSIDAVCVKDVLRDIDADCCWLHHLTSRAWRGIRLTAASLSARARRLARKR
ncbi:hypothetical protein [Hyphomicrobium sp. D-2]|uniref:hypothetical protein n=1 Tax=Hyphomicrobium sp. D-2 TaxID=3041621 RepID=UPI0024547DD5|nr:hypothetical protein [Hyphomicrobium sp. D-2]MDH4982179.1 hypothetical protein [Hyphomicrobium sp. D-2]